MRLATIFLVLLCAAATATRPAATSEPASDVSIAHGSVRFTPPDGWRLASKGENGLNATYNATDASGMIAIAISPQQAPITDAPKAKMAATIVNAIAERFKKDGTEVLLAPRVERDERVYLRIHDRSRTEGKVADRVQIYRVVGLNLVLVSVVAFSDDEVEAKTIHEIGRQVLESAHPAKPTPPTVFPRNRFSLMPPDKWKQEKSDTPNGLAATYRHPSDPSQQIIVKSRVLPKESRDSAERKAAIIDQMIDADRNGTLIAGAERTGELDVQHDAKYLRNVRATYDGADGPLQADSRYWAVGDVIIGVTAVAPLTRIDQIRQVADEVAESVKALSH